MEGACALSEETAVETSEITEQVDPTPIIIEEHHCVEDGNSPANSPDVPIN